MSKKSKSKKARMAFDRDALRAVCEMPEQTFGDWYEMEKYALPEDPEEFYFYKDNGSDILAVAHLDTVAPDDQRSCGFIDTAGGEVVYSRALDDRLGAYILLEMLPKLGIKHDVLLTVGEEMGNSTASLFNPKKDYLWGIEFDRGGTDVVMYQYDDPDSRALVRASGAKVGEGIFTDICYLEHLEVKMFNWGVGYREYHYPRSHAFLDDTFMMVGQYLRFHEKNRENYMPHDARAAQPWGRWWERGYEWLDADKADDPFDPEASWDDEVSEYPSLEEVNRAIERDRVYDPDDADRLYQSGL